MRLATLAVFAAMVLPSIGSVQAAPDKPVVAHMGIGASLPQGDTADFLDDGWALHGGATWFSPDRPVGLRLDFGIDWWDVSDDVLQTIDTDPSTVLIIEPPDDGYARAWDLEINGVWNPDSNGRVGFYLTGGVGIYYTTVDITEDGYVGSYWCDWWWGVCYPTVVSGQFIIQSSSEWEWGYNAGGGLTLELASGAELYLEAVYHWVQTENKAEYIPLTFGVRW